MPQDKSSMFSDAVYLFGTIFSSTPWYSDDYPEELPDGTRVDQKKLAEQAVLAAFAYLYHKKLIDLVLGRRSFVYNKKLVQVKKLQASAPDTSGLEAIIFSSIFDKSDMYGLTRALIHYSGVFSNPWGKVLQIVKRNLLQRGLLKRVEKGKVFFITTYKYVVTGDLAQEENQVTELEETLEELQSQGELYESMLSAIAEGLSSRAYSPG